MTAVFIFNVAYDNYLHFLLVCDQDSTMGYCPSAINYNAGQNS